MAPWAQNFHVWPQSMGLDLENKRGNPFFTGDLCFGLKIKLPVWSRKSSLHYSDFAQNVFVKRSKPSFRFGDLKYCHLYIFMYYFWFNIDKSQRFQKSELKWSLEKSNLIRFFQKYFQKLLNELYFHIILKALPYLE